MANLATDSNLKYWMVVDRDEHHIPHFEEIVKWCEANNQYYPAVSNPCFELMVDFSPRKQQ